MTAGVLDTCNVMVALNSFTRCRLSKEEINTCESHKESQDVIGALEDSEDSQVPHDLFQAVLSHVTHSAHDLRKTNR
jgi:hypothetical protein